MKRSISRMKHRILGFLHRFASDQGGGATILTILGTIAVIGMSGLTIDGARALYIHERLASALDAAALAGGRAINSGTPNQWQTDAWMYFHANFPSNYLGTSLSTDNPTVTLNAPYNTTLTVQQSLNVPSTIMRAFGASNGLAITAQAVAQAGKVELAMVLDNTGSMNQVVISGGQSKIAALQAAATQLVNTLTGDSSGNVRISIVPFSTTVNVGSSHQKDSWIDPTAQYIYAGYRNTLLLTPTPYKDIFTDGTGANYQQNRLTLLSNLKTTWAGCIENRPAPYDVQDDVPTATTIGTQYVPYFAPDEPDATWTYKNPSPPPLTITGSYSNSYLNDVSTDTSWQTQQGDHQKYSGTPAPTQNIQNNSIGPNSGCSLEPLTPLTSDTQALGNEINGMNPGGNTFIPVGMQMGWMTISPNSPFANIGLPYGTKGLNKAVVLLTDGCNHLTNPNYSGSQDACQNYSAGSATPNANASYYTAIGYTWQNRLGNLVNGVPVDTNSMVNRQALADQRLATLCANMKAANKNVTVYTILLGDQANAAPAVISSCASSPDDYFPVADPANLNNVFLTIAEKLTLTRLIQ